MKLRSIRLENVRRFVRPVEVSGIQDGLNVLTAPNEHGKSTFFDALHAVFFFDRKSTATRIKSLVPHAGGVPSVAVEVELDYGRFRIEKMWKGRGGTVRILRAGRIHKQADEAERWIKDVLKAPKDGGPSGLLWVRQGHTGLDTKDMTDARKVRHDLMQSVAGEVEDITGGRRMEQALVRCRKELDRHVTTTGRPKKRGPLFKAEDAERALRRQVDGLRDKCSALQSDLERRRNLLAELVGLEDPEEVFVRITRLRKAESAQAEAMRHADALRRAEEIESAKHGETERAQERIKELRTSLRELDEAGNAERQAAAKAAAANKALGEASDELGEVRGTYETARKAVKRTSDIHTNVLKARVSASAAERRNELNDKLARAIEMRAQAERSAADTKREITAADHERMEKFQENVRVIRRARDTQAAAVTMWYSPGRLSGVSIDGDPLPDAERRSLPDGADLDIEGMGVLTVHPGRMPDDDSLLDAESEFEKALSETGCRSMEDARASARRRGEAERRGRDAEAALKSEAPNGIAALREYIATLPRPVAEDPSLPSEVDAVRDRDEAAAALTDIEKGREAAQAEFQRRQNLAVAAAAADESAKKRLQRASATLADIRDPVLELESRKTHLVHLRKELANATGRREHVRKEAPDLEFVGAALKRAHKVVENAASRTKELNLDLARLSTSIAMHAGEAVEEELKAAENLHEKASSNLAAVRFEVAVLDRLNGALTDARTAARERYVAPVVEELVPMIKRLWPNAEIRFDRDTLLPQALVRRGTEEDFNVLSGGTKEQIALLVRLAFARMLAKDGRPAPVILDDSIVFTDDNRIEVVADLLTRQADDFQIIVFSCRQKAFGGLGGEFLRIRPVAA